MPYEEVEAPIPCPEAFRENTSKSVQSQAALLLIIGRKLRGDEEILRSSAELFGRGGYFDSGGATYSEQFPVPPLPVVPARSIDVHKFETALRARYRTRLRGQISDDEALLGHPAVLFDLANELYRLPTAKGAAELLEACLYHSDELVRVAAAASYFHLSTNVERLTNILVQGTRSEDTLVREIAATSLSHIAPEHDRLREMTRSPERASGAAASHTSILIHGTFARDYSWWKPGGDFHSYVLSEVRDDLYSGEDRYAWTGGYSDNARNIAGTDLIDWITGHDFLGLDLLTHSHGGSVAMIANNMAIHFGKLILLSCPVHVDKYLPNFSHVKKVVSLHVHLDLVLLADRAGLSFNHPNIEENILSVWFDHSATHYPEVWRKHDIPSLL